MASQTLILGHFIVRRTEHTENVRWMRRLLTFLQGVVVIEVVQVVDEVLDFAVDPSLIQPFDGVLDGSRDVGVLLLAKNGSWRGLSIMQWRTTSGSLQQTLRLASKPDSMRRNVPFSSLDFYRRYDSSVRSVKVKLVKLNPLKSHHCEKNLDVKELWFGMRHAFYFLGNCGDDFDAPVDKLATSSEDCGTCHLPTDPGGRKHWAGPDPKYLDSMDTPQAAPPPTVL